MIGYTYTIKKLVRQETQLLIAKCIQSCIKSFLRVALFTFLIFSYMCLIPVLFQKDTYEVCADDMCFEFSTDIL